MAQGFGITIPLLYILSHFQAETLLAARIAALPIVEISVDLNATKQPVSITDTGVVLAADTLLTWDAVKDIADSENGCFAIEPGRVRKLQAYNEETGRMFSLYPTAGAPTMLLSGLPMHRIKDTDPYRDTLSKIRATDIRGGRVLDTATGLGYTAIEAAKLADHVVTIEIDTSAQAMCRLNPWSRGLFDNPENNADHRRQL